MAAKPKAPDGVVKARSAARRRKPAVSIRAAEQQLEYAQGFIEAAQKRLRDVDLQQDTGDLLARITNLRLDCGQLGRQVEDA